MYVTRLKICLRYHKSNILLLQFCIRVTFCRVTLRPCLSSSNSPVTLWPSLFHPNWPVCVPRVIVPASGEHVQLSIFLFLCPHVRDDKWVRGERIKSPKCNAKTTKNPSARISFTHLWMPIARKRIQLDVRIRFPPPPPQWRRDNVNDRMSKCSAPLQLCHTSADYWEWVAYDLLYLNNIWQPFPITE